MAEKKIINTELQPIDKLLDSSGDAGTSGQILSSTGSGTNWVTHKCLMPPFYEERIRMSRHGPYSTSCLPEMTTRPLTDARCGTEHYDRSTV